MRDEPRGRRVATWIEAAVAITSILGIVSVTLITVVFARGPVDWRLTAVISALLFGVAVGASPRDIRDMFRSGRERDSDR